MVTILHMIFKLITRSSVKSFTVPLAQRNKHSARGRTLNSVRIRELMMSENRSNNPLNIPRNKSGANEYIRNILDSADHRISLEISPCFALQTDILDKISPRFVAVTWLGNTYLELPNDEIPAIFMARMFSNRDFPVLLHLAGRNIGKERMLELLRHVKDAGIKNILALQGDWPHVLEPDDTKCDFPYASDLVLFIKENFGDDFCVGVAGYPNIHPHCSSFEEDIKYLKLKVSNGADFIITQAAFEYEALEKFAINCREHNINVPILPGIFVIKSYNALINIAKCCEFKVPESVFDFVKKNRQNADKIENYGLDLAAELIRKCSSNTELFAGAHIFSMNDLNEVQKLLSKV